MSAIGITVTVRDGVAVLSAINACTTMAFLGASCQASVMPGTELLSNITLSPQKGQDAVVALITYCRYGGKTPDMVIGGLIRLSWRDEKLLVDTNEPFVSSPDRLGQVVPNRLGQGSLHLTTAGQVFGYSFGTFATAHGEELQKNGGRIVRDANLLCRYLVGQATFEELTTAATGDLKTAEQVRLADLQTELDRVEKQRKGELDQMREHVESQVAERHRIQKLLLAEGASNEVLRRELSEALRERNDLKAKFDKTLGQRLRLLGGKALALYRSQAD